MVNNLLYVAVADIAIIYVNTRTATITSAIYLGYTKSSGADSVIFYRSLLKFFFLYILIAQVKLYNSMIFQKSSNDTIRLKTEQKQ